MLFIFFCTDTLVLHTEEFASKIKSQCLPLF